MDELLFQVEFQGKTPLYEQLYEGIKTAIISNKIEAGKRMPSKLDMSRGLGISKNTVESAYELLCAEGYLTARPRSGYYVAEIRELPRQQMQAEFIHHPKEEKKPAYRWDFSLSSIDTELFPFSTWARLTKEELYGHPEILERGNPQGDEDLRGEIANFLRETRRVNCRPDQIILGAGIEMLMDLICKLMPDSSRFGIENPGYQVPYRILKANRREIVSIPLDVNGIDISALEGSEVTVAYVTPSHQFPLGMVMPVSRRSELLRWAGKKEGRYIIEDDYDSEFRFQTRPIPAMQSLDHLGKVIYMGTFSRTIAPSIRIAYLVLPEKLLKKYKNEPPYTGSFVSRIEQRTLCRFLKEGYYARHLRRALSSYGRRREMILEELRKKGPIQIHGEEGGLHFLLTIPGQNEKDLILQAEKKSMKVTGLSAFYHGGQVLPGTLVLGYGAIPEKSAADAGKQLAELITKSTDL